MVAAVIAKSKVKPSPSRRKKGKAKRPGNHLPTKLELVREYAGMPPLQPNGTRLLSKREVIAQVNLQYSRILELIREKQFPQPVDNSGRPNWIEGQIHAWQMSRPFRIYE